MDTVGASFFQPLVFGIARQDDAIDAGGARCGADELDELPNFRLKMLASAESLWIEQQQEGAVSLGIDRRFASRAASGKCAGQDVDDHSQSEALVGLSATKREDRAGRFPIENARISGRAAFGVEQPSFGAASTGDLMHAHLSFRRHAGAEIEHQWMGRGGNAIGDRIGAKSRSGAAGWSHAPSSAVRVGHKVRDNTGLRSQLAILAEPSDVTRVAKGGGDDTGFLDALECLFEQPSHLHTSEPPVPVRRDRRASILEDGQIDAGRQFAFPEHLKVKGDAHDTMGGIPQGIGKRKTRPDDGGIFGGNTTVFE